MCNPLWRTVRSGGRRCFAINRCSGLSADPAVTVRLRGIGLEGLGQGAGECDAGRARRHAVASEAGGEPGGVYSRGVPSEPVSAFEEATQRTPPGKSPSLTVRRGKQTEREVRLSVRLLRRQSRCLEI